MHRCQVGEDTPRSLDLASGLMGAHRRGPPAWDQQTVLGLGLLHQDALLPCDRVRISWGRAAWGLGVGCAAVMGVCGNTGVGGACLAIRGSVMGGSTQYAEPTGPVGIQWSRAALLAGGGCRSLAAGHGSTMTLLRHLPCTCSNSLGPHPSLKGSLHSINKRVIAPQRFHPVLDAGSSVCSFLQTDNKDLGTEGRFQLLTQTIVLMPGLVPVAQASSAAEC